MLVSKWDHGHHTLYQLPAVQLPFVSYLLLVGTMVAAAIPAAAAAAPQSGRHRRRRDEDEDSSRPLGHRRERRVRRRADAANGAKAPLRGLWDCRETIRME
ncbi:MAG: hypothetical protein AN484_26550 [Aphanizomenon flos-aquae WA102]|uniref:Uncharacterized protein n=1 Tax=Aphanizomenon flos-aquae WA102 TaxID=1710896 RepID=A0A1B7WC76_APHFL|nr:MAG: hypothetical protein AN484_26550 [Aphanizomenon flos-aquae WA102]